MECSLGRREVVPECPQFIVVEIDATPRDYAMCNRGHATVRAPHPNGPRWLFWNRRVSGLLVRRYAVETILKIH